jgi:hypothetical protein
MCTPADFECRSCKALIALAGSRELEVAERGGVNPPAGPSLILSTRMKIVATQDSEIRAADKACVT